MGERTDALPDNGDVEEKITVSQDVSATLASALVKAANAKGVIIAIAMEDDSIWFHTAGDLCTKLGLVKGLEFKAAAMFEDAPTEENEDE